MTNKRRVNPALQVAHAQQQSEMVVTLSTGVRARIRPVSAKLLDEVVRMVPEPEVPKQAIGDTGRMEENPLHPAYLRAVGEANHERGMRTTEALLMFGVELLEPIPPKEEWLPRLSYMAKRGNLNLGEYDLSDPLDLELLYKSMIAVATPDLMLVTMASGLTEQEVAQAEASFQRPEERGSDPDGRDSESA